MPPEKNVIVDII